MVWKTETSPEGAPYKCTQVHTCEECGNVVEVHTYEVGPHQALKEQQHGEHCSCGLTCGSCRFHGYAGNKDMCINEVSDSFDQETDDGWTCHHHSA